MRERYWSKFGGRFNSRGGLPIGATSSEWLAFNAWRYKQYAFYTGLIRELYHPGNAEKNELVNRLEHERRLHERRNGADRG
jgi:hypothetical protein